MIISELNLKHVIRMLLRESESSIDAKEVEIDSGAGGALNAIEVPDVKNEKQKIAILVNDNTIEIMFKPESSDPVKIPETSDEWHHALGAIITYALDSGSSEMKDELEKYLNRMYPKFKNDLQPLIIRYRNLA